MRRSEVLHTRRLDVDLKNGILTLRVTKNGETRAVYLNANAIAVLKSIPVPVNWRPTDLLFHGVTPRQASMAFHRACKAAKIYGCHLHDLRHTAASHMRLQGHGIDVIADLLGHRDLRMARRYQHLSEEVKREAVRSLDGVFGDLCCRDATEPKALPAPKKVSSLESWRA